LTNFEIIFFSYLLGIQQPNLYYANILLGIFNLCPIYPLDGGRLLKSLGNIFWGTKKAWNLTNKISNGIMIALTVSFSIAILFFHNIGIVLMCIYLWGIVIRENRIYEKKMKLYEQIELYDEKEAGMQVNTTRKYVNHF